MAAPDHEHRPKTQIFLLAVLTMAAAVYAVAGLARQVAEFGPRVGDIITFDPTRQVDIDTEARVTAARPGQGTCILDLASMRQTGGSLVLEQRDDGPNRLYRTHWAGPRTSDDPGKDCGKDTDLVLTRMDMGVIAAAAGGFGADHTDTLRLR